MTEDGVQGGGFGGLGQNLHSALRRRRRICLCFTVFIFLLTIFHTSSFCKSIVPGNVPASVVSAILDSSLWILDSPLGSVEVIVDRKTTNHWVTSSLVQSIMTECFCPSGSSAAGEDGEVNLGDLFETFSGEASAIAKKVRSLAAGDLIEVPETVPDYIKLGQWPVEKVEARWDVPVVLRISPFLDELASPCAEGGFIAALEWPLEPGLAEEFFVAVKEVGGRTLVVTRVLSVGGINPQRQAR